MCEKNKFGKKVPRAVSLAAKALSRLGASLGGKARAKKLSSERRKKIAIDAAKARWNNKE